MNRSHTTIFTIVILGLFLFSAHGSLAQQAATQADESARYLKQLSDATAGIEKGVQQLRDKGLGDQADKLASSQLAHYQQQLRQAKELVADGKVFGRAEYSAAINAITAQSKTDHQRAIMAIQQQATVSRNESDRQYQATVAASLKNHRDAIADANEKYRQQIDLIDLKSKFNGSRGQMGIVIWNLPSDQKLHQRLTTSVTLQLLSGSKVVWTKKNLKLNRKQPNTPIRLPDVMFDTVSVEVMKWSGSGGGLAEIQVFLRDENVAKGRPCEVSSIETLPTHLDDQHSLTDGVTLPTTVGDGYWIPEEDSKATVTINLLGKKITPAS
ncbi:hypothetical protein NHH03_20045 [Stieleria sp. TO1_6]|uniref:hypothetical protein n=1 Tax=Stieleria tagensis TaxID=2956795 RepID=UPI00209AD00B|nr:hypothetical protein [Stieleria tagensis]MCO8124047.1 hypothetical protein [Stieleria tagensis]